MLIRYRTLNKTTVAQVDGSRAWGDLLWSLHGTSCLCLFAAPHQVPFTHPHSLGLKLVQNSDSLWNELHAAGLREHDRFWRMPLDEEYGAQIYEGPADLINVSTQFRSALLRDSSDVHALGYTFDCTMRVIEHRRDVSRTWGEPSYSRVFDTSNQSGECEEVHK